jgi:wobble nucleotide-excising tRNase
MIKRINITNFGSYKNYVWASQMLSGGNVVEFKRLNILYGRNYSGKTTLSRLFRCLETRFLPPRYDTPQFEIVAEGGSINQTQINAHAHHVRVFNKDFVDANLSFLRDEAGGITPFAIVGQQNNDIQTQINEREQRLGSPETTGLRHQHVQKVSERALKFSELSQAKNEKTAKLTHKANKEIKTNRLYGHPSYTIDAITKDIDWIRTNNFAPFDEIEVGRHTTILRLITLDQLLPIEPFEGRLEKLNKTANALLGKTIRPTEAIQELLNDALLQDWVKKGIEHHRDKRSECAFCGAPLSPDLWTKIDGHFSKESEDLEREIDLALAAIAGAKSEVDQIKTPAVSSFYPDLKDEAERRSTHLGNAIKNYTGQYEDLALALQKRKASLFKIVDPVAIISYEQQINDCIQELNALIDQHNQQAQNLSRDQDASRMVLRRNEVAKFITDIDLAAIESRIGTLTTEERALRSDEDQLAEEVRAVEAELAGLRLQLRDERKGAEKVNEYLNHYFGHNGLSLVAVDQADGVNVRFEIRRGNQPAYNLSDGECSLVAFCYFVARLEDDTTAGKKLIVYIDDPISSLDSNHVFFVFSLIETLIAKPRFKPDGTKEYRYNQLFLSTHNLDFLKFIKRMTRPQIGGTEHFLVTRTATGSVLELMPAYLKQCVTEFHYLFDQIACCALEDPATSGHHCFFNFGNNLRKFFEVYLFFKYPWSTGNDYNRRVEKYFEADMAIEPLANRITNELSHSGEVIDRTMRPVEYDEISKLAKYVLRKLRASDAEQYQALLDAVSKTDPLPAI